MAYKAWRFWGVLTAGLAVYALLGWWWSSNGAVEAWLYRAGLTASAVLPVLFTVTYTMLARWWRNPIGSALVFAALALVPLSGPLAYVFWFRGGMLTSSWLAWLAVSGPALSALALLRMCWVWRSLQLQVSPWRQEEPEEDSDVPPLPGGGVHTGGDLLS